MLESAYESLERTAAAGKEDPRSLYSPAPIAGVLLAVAERIDPGLVEECLERPSRCGSPSRGRPLPAAGPRTKMCNWR